MSEIQDFIAELEKYPCLWNLDNENCQNNVSSSMLVDVRRRMKHDWAQKLPDQNV